MQSQQIAKKGSGIRLIKMKLKCEIKMTNELARVYHSDGI